MARRSDERYRDWVAEARKPDIVAFAERRGARLRRSGGELVGPCPRCGGTDRFSINLRKRVFNCRQGGGGDVIALAQYLDGCDFHAACETLTGRTPEGARVGRADPPPRSSPSRGEEGDRGETDYRERERRRAYAIWSGGGKLPGSAALAYLAGRGLEAPHGAPLRAASDLPYWTDVEREGRRKAEIVHRGPALLAAVTDEAGVFQGCHVTWIDALRPGEKATIAHPETGEILPAKKLRGSKRRSAIRLTRVVDDCTRLVIGEGVETVLSVWMSERDPRTAYWSAIDLGHLGGKAEASVPHPTLTRTDRSGAVRALKVAGAVPRRDPERDLMPTSGMWMITLLGDGDSDRFTTELALRRASSRWAQERRLIRIAWAPDGMDFNDVLRAG